MKHVTSVTSNNWTYAHNQKVPFSICHDRWHTSNWIVKGLSVVLTGVVCPSATLFPPDVLLKECCQQLNIVMNTYREGNGKPPYNADPKMVTVITLSFQERE